MCWGGLSIPATVIYLTNKNLNFSSNQNLANFVFYNLNNSLNKDNYLSDATLLADADSSIDLNISATDDVDVSSLNIGVSNSLNSSFSINNLTSKINALNKQNKSLTDAKKEAEEKEKKAKPKNTNKSPSSTRTGVISTRAGLANLIARASVTN